MRAASGINDGVRLTRCLRGWIGLHGNRFQQDMSRPFNLASLGLAVSITDNILVWLAKVQIYTHGDHSPSSFERQITTGAYVAQDDNPLII